MPEDFVIARNPDGDSSLPYLLRIPLGPDGVLVKSREMWPRTSKVYCHRVEEWPDDADIIERVPTRSCVRRGAPIDLVLDRGRENRSQLVLTQVRGRQVIFWQSARTAKQARPSVRTPTARAAGLVDLEVVVDSREPGRSCPSSSARPASWPRSGPTGSWRLPPWPLRRSTAGSRSSPAWPLRGRSGPRRRPRGG